MTDAMGALVIFDGIVRNHDHGSAVRGLSYSAHPQAREYIAEVAAEVAAELDGVRLWAVHRVGPIAIGESALTVMAAAAHRGRAFDACELVADRVKAWILRPSSLLNILNISLSGGFLSGRLILLEAWTPKIQTISTI